MGRPQNPPVFANAMLFIYQPLLYSLDVTEDHA